VCPGCGEGHRMCGGRLAHARGPGERARSAFLVCLEKVSGSAHRHDDGLPIASLLACAAPPHSAYRDGVPGRHGGRAQLGGAAVRRLVQGSKRREKGVFTDGASRFQVWSEDGARLLSTCVDNGARLLYICVDTCRQAATAEGARGHVTPPAQAPSARLSVAEEAAMIDFAAYVLEPLHQDGA